ncbi:MAG: PP2C family protein-serine/threonine phosphatase [Leptospirales bacterium]|jgi:sigma-B regulation protein RsbU (phosphoserine phosphatase)
MSANSSIVRSLIGLLIHRTTLAYAQGPVFVMTAVVCVIIFDPTAARGLPYWSLLIFVLYFVVTVMYTTGRLKSGAWSLRKWADRLLLVSMPAPILYGYIAYLMPAYFIVPAIGVLAAGLPLLGIGKNRLWLLWFAGFSLTYVVATFLTAFVSTDESFAAQTAYGFFQRQPTAYVLSLFAGVVMLFWLTRTSSHAKRVADRAAKHLIQARKSRRELDQANQELREKRARMDAELKIARRIQEGILPTTDRFSEHRLLSVGARYLALDGVGGDYYDFADLGEGCFGFFIADVSGHGVPAALVTGMTKVAFTNHAGRADADPALALGAINAAMYEFVRDLDHYLTAFYLIIDLKKGLARFSNGGHTPALLHRRSDNSIHEWTTAESFFLGVEAEFAYRSEECELRPGDRVILYTDGLTETQNPAGEFYGDRRLAEFLAEQAPGQDEQLVQKLVEDLDRFSAGRAPLDDIAMICIDYREVSDGAQRDTL